jgi:hypothetical protein
MVGGWMAKLGFAKGGTKVRGNGFYETIRIKYFSKKDTKSVFK